MVVSIAKKEKLPLLGNGILMAYCPDCSCFKCVRHRTGRCIDCGNMVDADLGNTHRCIKCQKKMAARKHSVWWAKYGKLWRYRNEEKKAGKE